MEKTQSTNEITNKDIIKHYLASALIYGVIYIFLIFCPVYYQTIENDIIDYTAVFLLLYVLYLLIAPIVFFTIKPKSILHSRSLTILKYIAKQFKPNTPLEDKLKNIEPDNDEKQALMTLFIQTFFGVYCINLLCNQYLPNLGYSFDFIKVMFGEAHSYAAQYGFLSGLTQFLIDSGDMILKLILMFSTVILTISYLTESDIFKNRIKSADTTPLGVLSCIICYYPITILTDKFIQFSQDSMLPVQNDYLLAFLNLVIILANFGSFLAILRLGTKSGNLTNRGIETRFPYNIVRHPDYAMQMIFIIFSSLPLYFINNIGILQKIIITVSIFAWLYIYYLRAITEERHLIKDEEYKKYVQKVKHRFIPKLF